MYKQFGSRPALLNSLNACFNNKPAEECFDRFSDGGYGSGKDAIISLVSLFLLYSHTFDGLDRSKQLIAFVCFLFIPKRIVLIYLVGEYRLSLNCGNAFTSEYGEVVLRCVRQDNLTLSLCFMLLIFYVIIFYTSQRYVLIKNFI